VYIPVCDVNVPICTVHACTEMYKGTGTGYMAPGMFRTRYTVNWVRGWYNQCCGSISTLCGPDSNWGTVVETMFKKNLFLNELFYGVFAG